jgi:hypothetical protein
MVLHGSFPVLEFFRTGGGVPLYTIEEFEQLTPEAVGAAAAAWFTSPPSGSTRTIPHIPSSRSRSLTALDAELSSQRRGDHRRAS